VPLAAIPSPVSASWLGAGYRNKAFTGREWDPETGLYYYRARYYDPVVGRCVSEDPIRWLGGINLHRYAGSNPGNFVDPTGLDLLPDGFTGPPKPGDTYQKQLDIYHEARRHVGSEDWSWWVRNGEVRAGAFKCNKFVNDILTASGVPVPRLHGRFGPVAADWANPQVKIPCCSVVSGPPALGDVIAIPSAGPGYTGHVAIVVGPGLSVSQSAADDEVVINDWGFRSGQNPTIRRCRCP
jgi:RHS repeat-associated protein